MIDETPKTNYDLDVAVSSRVRLARNFEGIPFTHILSGADKEKIIGITRKAIESSPESKRYAFIGFDRLSGLQMNAFAEQRVVSPDFIKSPPSRELIVNLDESVYIMVNEEDHLRIQSMTEGFSVDRAYTAASAADAIIESRCSYAFDAELGYLTRCPTNLGTGMRVSVMLHLPSLVKTGALRRIVSDLFKIGLTIRGLYGEGTEASGDLYQVSNQVTLGVSEEETIDKLKKVISRMIELERSVRSEHIKNNSEKMIDSVMRSYGILMYAHMIDAAEFLSLYSDARLGVSAGMLQGIDLSVLDSMLVGAMPSSLALGSGGCEGVKCDILRAEYIKKKLTANN